jgi:membrane-associated phospholipid phosphatase
MFFTGISAMPSMHVAATVLCAMVGWQLNRAVGLILALFAAIIQLGSVHLGWHYAVDGYLSALFTFLIWKWMGRVCENV